MNQYLILHYGFVQPTPEVMEGWNKWFASITDRQVEMHGLQDGVEITSGGRKKLPFGKDSLTGYTIIKAENLEEAEKIALERPYINSTHVYEIRN
jgi:hypothetical protein